MRTPDPCIPGRPPVSARADAPATLTPQSDAPARADVDALARLALDEDLGAGDLTAALIREDARCRARVIAREAAVLCGRDWFDAVYRLVDPRGDVAPRGPQFITGSGSSAASRR